MDNHINSHATEMLEFINASPTAFHAVANISKMLDSAGFIRLNSYSEKLHDGGKYYICKNSSALIAFIYRENFSGFNMASAHADSPGIRLKPNPVQKSENGVTKLNTETYGGLIMSSWLDRVLGLAGRLVYDKQGKLAEKLVCLKDIAIIPNVAIHMQRKINEGYTYNAQNDLCAVSAKNLSNESLSAALAENAKIPTESILASDLYLYPCEDGKIWGMDSEFVTSPRLDDLMCAFGLSKALINTQLSGENIPVCVIFDNEEVGSSTKQGADSTFLHDVLSMIADTKFGMGLADKLSHSFMVSADNAHAVHPLHPEFADICLRPELNGGIVIKRNASQRYATDAFSEARLVKLLKENDIPYQFYSNRSDIAGGSTLGNISTSHISVDTVDIGLCQYAMHSSNETAGAFDIDYLLSAMTAYYKS